MSALGSNHTGGDLIVAGVLGEIAMTMTRFLASGEALEGEPLRALRDQIVVAAEQSAMQEEERGRAVR